MIHTLRTSCFILSLFFILSIPLSAQLTELEVARHLSYNGLFVKADSAYRQLINQYPDDLDIRIANAYNLSWQGKLKLAKNEFEEILKAYPNAKSALIGYGYALAWNEDYANAKNPFLAVLKSNAHDPDALKGLAYVYLWQQSPEVALDMFEKLQKENPGNAEFDIALAYAHLQKFETIRARTLVEHAIAKDPDNSDHRKLYSSLNYATPFAEVDVFAGLSKIADDNRFGIRAIQIQSQLSRKVRLLATYDNSMSLDNSFFVLDGNGYETFMAGGIMAWNKYDATKLQFAYREKQPVSGQLFLMAEHAIHLHDGKVLKAGGLLGSGDQMPDEWMLYAAINLPFSRTIRIEPAYFINRKSAVTKLDHRLSLNTQWIGRKGLEVNLGTYYGTVQVASESNRNFIYGAYMAVLFPLHRMVWIQSSLRREEGIFSQSTIAAFGVKVRFEK